MVDRSITRRQVLVGMGAASALAVAGPRIAQSGADTAAPEPLVQVDPTTSLGRLGARSIGFSFERSTLPLPLFDDANADLVGLFRLLGPGLLRVGAKTVDTTPWDPTGAGGVLGVVAPGDLARLRRFADAADWDVLHGLPFVLAGSSPATAADEAAVVVATLGDRVAAYEFGNEPDLYVTDSGHAALAGTLDLCMARWEAFADAVRDADPATPLTGPGCCLLQTLGSWTTPFVEAEAAALSLVTQHYYRGFGGAGQTIDLLLAPDPLLTSSLRTLATGAATAGADGFRLTETNSFASGGQPGVSNSFASALWAVGHHLDCTAAGAAGLNFHNSGSGAGYPAIVQIGGTVTEVRPLFYGLLLIAALGQGTHLAVTSSDLPATTRVHAIFGDDGDFRLVLRNLDTTTPVIVHVDLGVALASASVDRLEGPGLDATAGITYRGAPVAVDGGWDPAASEDLVVSGATVSLTVPAASAAVVRARPTVGPATTADSVPASSMPSTPTTTTSTTTSTASAGSVPSTTARGGSPPGSSLAAPATPSATTPRYAG